MKVAEFKSLLKTNPGWIDLVRPVHLAITYPAILTVNQFYLLCDQLSELPAYPTWKPRIALRAIDYSAKKKCMFILYCPYGVELIFE